LLAKFFAGITEELPKDSLESSNAEALELRKGNSGVLLLYPVRENKEGPVSIGFELFFPPNALPFDVNITVRRKAEKMKVIVDE
jgi:hypothetical protein